MMPPNQMVKHFQQKSITHSLCSVFNSIKTCCSLALLPISSAPQTTSNLVGQAKSQVITTTDHS
jgi:hypothetical protein